MHYLSPQPKLPSAFLRRTAGAVVGTLHASPVPLTRFDIAEQLGVGVASVLRAMAWSRRCGVWISSQAVETGFGTWDSQHQYALPEISREAIAKRQAKTLRELCSDATAPAWSWLLEANDDA